MLGKITYRRAHHSQQRFDPMKDLLVYIPPATESPHIIDYAASLASTMGAHLDGVTFTIVPELAVHYATMPDTLFQKVHQQNAMEAANAKRRFVEYAQRAGVQPEVHNFDAFVGDAEDIFARTAQAYDLAIVPQRESTDVAFFNPRFENIMFTSGRPTLFVPTIHRGPARLQRILLCWNGDRCAARAAGDALPLMKRAEMVDVLQIEPVDAGSPRCQAAEIVRHLRRHDVRATQHVFTRDNPDVGAAILSYAADCSANLIVMGGYGHSRTREMLLGGVTRELLESMTVPVLMSH
jgi:nucleotide-binding universal stress UspA family protein